MWLAAATKCSETKTFTLAFFSRFNLFFTNAKALTVTYMEAHFVMNMRDDLCCLLGFSSTHTREANYLQQQYLLLFLPYRPPMRWLSQIEPGLSVTPISQIVEKNLRYQKQVVLNEIIFERIDRQCAVRETSHEVVLSMIFPNLLDIRSFQDILYKPTSTISYQISNHQ